jgi:hypothetical protein
VTLEFRVKIKAKEIYDFTWTESATESDFNGILSALSCFLQFFGK